MTYLLPESKEWLEVVRHGLDMLPSDLKRVVTEYAQREDREKLDFLFDQDDGGVGLVVLGTECNIGLSSIYVRLQRDQHRGGRFVLKAPSLCFPHDVCAARLSAGQVITVLADPLCRVPMQVWNPTLDIPRGSGMDSVLLLQGDVQSRFRTHVNERLRNLDT